MKYKSFLVCGIIIIFSCTRKESIYDHTAIIEQLGANYYYKGDGNESQILLNLNQENSSGFGKTIIPPEVVQYNFDSNYIIAKTLKSMDGEKSYRYWVVDKREANDSLYSIDSINFFKKIDILKLQIKLIDRR
jgi:hypothetical protein